MPLCPDAPATYHPAALVSTFEMIDRLDHVFTNSTPSLDEVLDEVTGSSSQNSVHSMGKISTLEEAGSWRECSDECSCMQARLPKKAEL